MANNDPVTLEGHLFHYTPKALLLDFTGNNDKDHATWVPRSQLMSMHDEDDLIDHNCRPRTLEVVLPEWLAKEKELI